MTSPSFPWKSTHGSCHAFRDVSVDLGGKAGAALMSLLLGVGWAGLGTSLGATFQRVMQVFPQTDGWAIGVLKASVGAGGAVLPALYFGFMGVRPGQSMLGMKFFPAYSSGILALATLAVTSCMDAKPGFSRSEARVFLRTAVAVILITAAATASSLSPLGSISMSLAVLALLLLVLLLAGSTCLPDNHEESGEVSSRGQQSESTHIIIQQAVLTWEYWVYIAVFCTCAGSGQMVLTNLYQIAAASGHADKSEALLCLVNFGSMLGRLTFGVACDVLRRRRASRTLLFVLCNLLGISGQALLYLAAVSGNDLLLYVGAVVVGFGFGGSFPTLVNVCAARWGHATLSANWTFMDAVGNGCASILFGSILGSSSYDRHADGSHSCFGPQCFALPHMVMAFACALGAALSLVLIWRHPRNSEIRRSLSQSFRLRSDVARVDIAL
ncbi:gpmA [Symbiodinium natans]|uniref:GpmA protein n=1 Tax=Symbiodinium natans TaxID=878477 RepID=A0A812JKS3_9DINO|nr:gpmA [Symbiodinium natans]